MAKYIPTPNGIKYGYDETTESEKTLIKSSWKVELSANETIEVQEPVDVRNFNFYVELYVKSTGGPASDHTWEGTVEIKICPDKEYDPATVTELSEKQNIVREKIMNLLSFYNSDEYLVLANVTQENSITGHKGTDTVSGSSVIEID